MLGTAVQVYHPEQKDQKVEAIFCYALSLRSCLKLKTMFQKKEKRRERKEKCSQDAGTCTQRESQECCREKTLTMNREESSPLWRAVNPNSTITSDFPPEL